MKTFMKRGKQQKETNLQKEHTKTSMMLTNTTEHLKEQKTMHINQKVMQNATSTKAESYARKENLKQNTPKPACC